MLTIKKCNKCGIVKPISEFYTHKMCAGGIRPDCKACYKITYTSWRLKNIDKVRAIRKARYANTRGNSIRATGIWQKENKDMANANKKRYEVQHLLTSHDNSIKSNKVVNMDMAKADILNGVVCP